jgi:hypothetical protein
MPKNTENEPAEGNPIYLLSDNAAFEAFDDGALILNLKGVYLTELNTTAREIILESDGTSTIEQIAKHIASTYEIDKDIARMDVMELYKSLLDKGIIEQCKTDKSFSRKKEGEMTEKVQVRYLCNPDVVLREEDEDGGLLFNPDTNQVRVMNATGLFIWNQFSSPNEIDDVVATLKNNFEEVPIESVQKDVQDFISEMLLCGFIGTVVK